MGTPISIEESDPDHIWISDTSNLYKEIEMSADLEKALSILTELQRYCFVEVCLNERTYVDIARERNKHHSTVQEAIKSAQAKLKKYFF